MKLKKYARIFCLKVATLVVFSANIGHAQSEYQYPGKGIIIQPGQENIEGENFQTILVVKALKELGYEVKDVQNARYPLLHVAIANGDVTFMADHWNPLHRAFFD